VSDSSPTPITPRVIEEHGLRPEEYRSIVERLGREPSLVELGVYSVMWSEHCAYKHSRPVLKNFPVTGPRVLVGPGENAGVIDLGDGLCVAFKMESHNHPSAVEPYQGAATGVGGILRDIFTMGARPVAMLDNLRFGDPADPAMQHLIEGVIEGIAGYGNCVGVPTVAGDVMFDAGYQGNILVNVMCVGIARVQDIVKGCARGAGNAVLYFGSPTGRDGIHGATFASEELSEEALERRGAVQVGDPFMGKKILEATLELIRRGLVVGIQDMGAAGLTCSTCEMAGRASTGIEIDLDKVPQRAPGMTAYEIMLSESQERMLAVCEPEKVAAALEVCERWDCGPVVIGRVTDTGRMVVRHGGRQVADIPAHHLTNEAPVYHPAAEPPAPPEPFAEPPALEPDAIETALLALLARPNIASKRWAYRRYDHMVQTATVVRPGEAAAAVLRLRDTEGRPVGKFLALTADCNARWVARDPYLGGQMAVCEASRNLVCVGAEPLGMTNCLNFGSPERPSVFWTFRRCVEGMAAACRALGVPVTGGNVSFYNETNGAPIPPTPMVGMVGLIERREWITRPAFQSAGDIVVVLGDTPRGLGGSEFAAWSLGPDLPGRPLRGEGPVFDLEAEVRLQRAVRRAIREGLLRSAHDTSEGGLAVALAECVIASREAGLGAEIEAAPGAPLAEALFGETPPRIVASVAPHSLERLFALSQEEKIFCRDIGTVVASGGLRLLGTDLLETDRLREAFVTPPFEGLA